jgi:hypothetical protein
LQRDTGGNPAALPTQFQDTQKGGVIFMGKFIDLTGQKFGRLTVLGLDRVESKKTYWKCMCECNNEISVRSDQLRRSWTKSCGCLQRDVTKKTAKYINYKHGESKTRLYGIWTNMKSRCYREHDDWYSEYGGRGITICNEWINDYVVFRNWALSHGYMNNLTIDRKDVNGNYEPNNCRWATLKEQANNTRYNHLMSYNGKTQTMSQWADELGIGFGALMARSRRNWTDEQIITTPLKEKKLYI